MPRYYPIRRLSDTDGTRSRCIDRLLALRKKLQAEIGVHRSDASLLLATWNIRDFDSNKFGHGKRLPEAFHYIAEIISFFDLVAIREVNRDLSGLQKVMNLLGGAWDYIVTDTTEGSGGNQERMAFVFDKRKILFRNIAGEVVLPSKYEIVVKKAKKKGDKDKTKDVVLTSEQFVRTPFVVAFQAGWFKFNLCTVHLFYGAASGNKLQRRIDEIRAVASFFSRRQDQEKEDFILLGDFNIVKADHPTMQPLRDEKYLIPKKLTRKGSNLGGDMHYDQIALKVRDKRLEIGESGVFDLYDSVYRNADADAYLPFAPADKRDFMPAKKKGEKGRKRTKAEKAAYYRNEWRTWQMSDHKPLWVKLKVDFTEDYLKSLKPGLTPLTD